METNKANNNNKKNKEVPDNPLKQERKGNAERWSNKNEMGAVALDGAVCQMGNIMCP